MLHFLPADLRDLDKKISRTREQIEASLQEIGKSKEGSSGNTAHDNFAFEDAQREAALWSTRLRELLELRKKAVLVDISHVTGDVVAMGTEVKIDDVDFAETMALQIRGYLVESREDAMSWQSPLAQIIAGAKAGETRKGRIGDRERTFRILSIKKIGD